MVVDGDGKNLLGGRLTNHILVQYRADLVRYRQIGLAALAGFITLDFLADDVIAQLDALVTDEHRGPGDEFTHLMLALAAEGAIQEFFAVARFFRHCVRSLPSLD